jgi:hypothetical protein
MLSVFLMFLRSLVSVSVPCRMVGECSPQAMGAILFGCGMWRQDASARNDPREAFLTSSWMGTLSPPTCFSTFPSSAACGPGLPLFLPLLCLALVQRDPASLTRNQLRTLRRDILWSPEDSQKSDPQQRPTRTTDKTQTGQRQSQDKKRKVQQTLVNLSRSRVFGWSTQLAHILNRGNRAAA